MNLEILFEDTDIVAINKPVGMLVHGDGRTDQATVADWVLEHYPDTKEVGEPIETKDGITIYRPGIVHRLDKNTSGVLLLAKTSKAHADLKEQFQERKIDKTYRAFVYGELKYDEGSIESPIGRSRTFTKWTAIPKALRGTTREAETTYKALHRFDGFSYVELKPKTGRTHQIRVHMQYINYPIVADYLYAGKRYNKDKLSESLGFTRQALHAYKIAFTDLGGQDQEVTAPFPQDFSQVLERYNI